LQRKFEEIETENKSIEAENQKLLKNIENLKSTARRVEQLEKDNFDLESIQHKIERENKSLLREVDRLKQSVEVKDVTLEEVNSKMASLERERNKLSRDLDTWTSEQSKNLELENENRRLNQQRSVDKRALVRLREELVEEKLKCDGLSQQLEKIGKKMTLLGIDVATLDSDDGEIISNE
jgi:chromosome segregation ATPase